MPTVRPFQAIRPVPELAHKVAALPYDVMSSEEAWQEASQNPYSFLHIDKAEIDLDRSVPLYDDRVYEKARDNLNRMISEGVFLQDEKPCLYIYRQVMDGRTQTGIVGCASIDDYRNNVIKRHELTRADKEQDRIRHVDTCNANTGPIFLTYQGQPDVKEIAEKIIAACKPVYDFTRDDGVSHAVWLIEDPAVIDSICGSLKQAKAFYIADGHHRCASAVQVGMIRRAESPDFDGSEEFNYFLSVIFPAEQLYIMDYNRLVRDLNGYSVESFLEKVSESFIISPYTGDEPLRPEKKHTFGMYLNGKWMMLEAKNGTYDCNDPVAQLDVSILQSNLLSPILGIGDPRTDERIDFVGGIRGLQYLADRVDSGEMRVAFSMFPTTIEDLIAVSDCGAIMPPKSTWFEPKLRSGLFIHKLSD